MPTQLQDITTRLRAAGCVFAEDEAELLLAAAGDDDGARLQEMVRRRTAGEPLEHVVGWAAFCGLRIAVGPGTFVPRRRSEFLVEQAVAILREQMAAAGAAEAVAVDLCCGTGAITAAIAHALGPGLERGLRPGADPDAFPGHGSGSGLGFGPAAARAAGVAGVSGAAEVGISGISGVGDAGWPKLRLHAADIDPAQTAWARRNLPAATATVHDGDLYDALPPELCGHVDLITANAPYVPTGELSTLPAEARDHEPRTALDGGTDGVALHRRIAAAAPAWLRPGGRLLIETSHAQTPLTVAAFTAAGLDTRVAYCDDLEATVVIGRLPA